MKFYRIKHWNEHFENNRSRVVEDLRWVALPNRHDGEGFSLVMAHRQAAELFAAWCLIVQVASKCAPRGSLVRDNGTGLDAAALALKTRGQKKWFEAAFEVLTQPDIDWLEEVDNMLLAGECQASDTQLTPKCEERKKEEKEGKGKKTAGEAAGEVAIPQNLDTAEFRAAWAEWAQYRKEKRKPQTVAGAKRQLTNLEKIGVERAIAAINHSIACDYQGIYEPSSYRAARPAIASATAPQGSAHTQAAPDFAALAAANKTAQLLALTPQVLPSLTKPS